MISFIEALEIVLELANDGQICERCTDARNDLVYKNTAEIALAMIREFSENMSEQCPEFVESVHSPTSSTRLV